MADHHDDIHHPDQSAAGFRLSVVGPRGMGKAWRAPLSPIWHVAFEPKGAPDRVEKKRFRHAAHVEDWLYVRVAGPGEHVEILYDGQCDPSASEEDNRETFIVGQPRRMVLEAARKPFDTSPWAMTVTQDRAETEGRRVAALANAEARQRRAQDRERRGGR